MRKWLCLITLFAATPTALPQERASGTDLTRKYRLRVLLRCGAHNWLSEQFRADLCGNLGSTLQDALGGMADVEVSDLHKVAPDQWQKWWRDVDAKGLAAIETVSTDATGDKTHFLRIDFRNGHYELQSRQIDVSTGLVSPLRSEQTDDRAFVARLAGLMLAYDFGIVGTVDGQGDSVAVSFKGGALSPALNRWIKKGDVFALAKMTVAAGQERGTLEKDTLVQVLQDPVGGKAPCKVSYRQKINPLAQRGSAGFRCVKLPTSTGPLRLRILDDKGQPHAKALQIRVHSEAFQSGESAEEELVSPDSSGLFISRRPFDNMAYVRVVTGASQIARLPVAILEDRPAVALLRIDAAAEELGQLQEAKRNLLQMYNEALLVQVERLKETTGLMRSDKLDEALGHAKISRRTLEVDVERLEAQRDSLRKEIGSHPIALSECTQYGEAFTVRKSTLNRLIFDLQQAVDEKNSPERKAAELELKTLFAKGQLHESNFDIDDALAVYEQLQKKFGAQKAVADRIAKLKSEWEIKSDVHRTARDFVYKDWPLAKTAAETEAKLPKAKEALQTLKQAGDQLTLYKLRNTLPELVKRITDEVAQSASDSSEDSAKKAKLQKFGEEFDKFAQEVDAALSKKS